MAVPALIATTDGYNQLLFTRGEAFGYDPYGLKANQDIEYTRDGKGMVRVNGANYREFNIVVANEVQDTVDDCDSFFDDVSIKMFEGTFSYYPDYDNDKVTYYTCRLLEIPQITRQHSLNSEPLYTIRIRCKSE